MTETEGIPQTEEEKARELKSSKQARLNSIISMLIAAICGYAASILWMPGNSYGELGSLTDSEKALASTLKQHVEILAGTIGERNLAHYDKLEAAARYIENSLAQSGFTSISQVFEVEGKACRNIEIEFAGTTKKDEILVIGAHYDTAPGTPGADGNGSGVAALLELAKLLKGRTLERTVRLVAFPNEEPPYFRKDAMGSYHWAKAAHERKDKIVGMLALETMGSYSDEPGSQTYPIRGGTLFYPKRGNFIAFVSNQSASVFNRECVGTFRRLVDFPSQGFALPDFVVGVNYSDDWSFNKFGYPATMVTDTAPYRIKTYHQPSDLPDTLNYESMAQVVAGLSRTIGDIAGEKPAK